MSDAVKTWIGQALAVALVLLGAQVLLYGPAERRKMARFDRIEAQLDRMIERFDGVDARFDQVEERFDRFEARMIGRLDSLEGTFEAGFRRMHECFDVLDGRLRPWED